MSEDRRAMVAQSHADGTVQEAGGALDFGVQTVVHMDQAIKRMRELHDFVRAVMVKDEDYGIIPGTQKPTLFKPGAEKLCEMYGLVPTFQVTDSVKDWDAPFFYVEVKCALVSKRTGGIVAEGLGSCNSREKRYRNQDVYGVANTILKMGKKRAHVDATLSATRSSGLFTQDLEDLEPEQLRKPQAQQPTIVQPPRPIVAPPANAPPADTATARPPPRAEIERRYRALVDRADGLMVAADPLSNAWSDDELAEKGRQLLARVKAREGELASTAGAR